MSSQVPRCFSKVELRTYANLLLDFLANHLKRALNKLSLKPQSSRYGPHRCGKHTVFFVRFTSNQFEKMSIGFQNSSISIGFKRNLSRRTCIETSQLPGAEVFHHRRLLVVATKRSSKCEFSAEG